MPDYLLAAMEYFQEGIMAMPLTWDNAGYPKRPIVPGWSTLVPTLDVLKSLPWEEAQGIGLLLGPVSGGLAAIDVDDVELAEHVLGLCHHTRCVRTVRNRCHVYVREAIPSRSSRFTIAWNGTQIIIELKAQGTQVAAPPTKGYSFVHDKMPKAVPTISVAWEGIARRLGIRIVSGDGYPRPWQPRVARGERDQAAYIEAHFLRQAGMPEAMALRYMRLRWEQDYEQGEQEWGEIENTVRSAYNKGQMVSITELYDDTGVF